MVLSGCFLFNLTASSNFMATALVIALSYSSIRLSWNEKGDSFIIYRSKENPNNFSQSATIKDSRFITFFVLVKIMREDPTIYV
jgi:hypothetical protein